MIRFFGLAVLLSLGPSALRAEMAETVYPALHAVVDVAADDVLNIRAAPDSLAEIIGALVPDQTGVEVIRVNKGWAQVNTGDATGYVSQRYLAREGGSDWYALTQPLSCFGTEPFWSLSLNADTGTALFTTPDTAKPRQDALGQTWPGAPWAPTAAIDLPDGLAVLRPADCSDGMSDLGYGIAIDLFLRSGDRQRLSGCCTLAPG